MGLFGEGVVIMGRIMGLDGKTFFEIEKGPCGPFFL
jgi:hypothetical protein